jgi:streptogramin lyase
MATAGDASILSVADRFGSGRRGGRFFTGLAVACGLASAISIGCGKDRVAPAVDDGGGGGDGTQDASADDVGDADQSDGRAADDARDAGSAIDRSFAPDAASDGGADATPPPICAGLGKVEDPTGCSGARICDGAGNCVSRFTEYAVPRRPAAASSLGPITTGADGNLWFVDGDQIDRMTVTGVATPFVIPGAAFGVARGSDGNVWFTDWTRGTIGRITPAGAFSEFPPVGGRPVSPEGIVAGPDGNLWFVDVDRIGRITPTGSLTEFAIPTSVSYPTLIAVGPDGNLWFTEQTVAKIGRITLDGVITEFPAPVAPGSAAVWGIAAGPDGNLWFTESVASRIGRMTPTGAVTDFPIPSATGRPDVIVAGPDGNLWFLQRFAGIGRITPAGVITEIALPSPNTYAVGITVGPDGAIWFTEQQSLETVATMSSMIVRMQP